MQTFFKQPIEVLDYDVDFSDWLPDGDTITGIVVEVDIEGELTATAVPASPVVKVWAAGGVNKATYKIPVTATTEGGRVKQTEFRIRIKEL